MILPNEYRDIKKRGMCQEYSSLWRKADTLYDMYGIASKAESAKYYNKIGWLTPTYIKRLFHEYVNKTVFEQPEGYNSIIYCDCSGIIKVPKEVTCMIVLNCNCIFEFEDYTAQSIYLCGHTNSVVFGKGKNIDLDINNLHQFNNYNIKYL